MRLGGIVRRLNKTLEDVRNKLQYIRLPNNIDSLSPDSSNLHARAVWFARDDHLSTRESSVLDIGCGSGAPRRRVSRVYIYAAPRNFSEFNFSCAP